MQQKQYVKKAFPKLFKASKLIPVASDNILESLAFTKAYNRKKHRYNNRFTLTQETIKFLI